MHARHLRVALGAAGGAVLVQPILYAAWVLIEAGTDGELPPALGFLFGAIMVLIVATVFVFILGLPAFWALRLGHKHAAETGAVGFVLAGLPLAILNWPLWQIGGNFSSGANWHGHYVDFFIDSRPTLYGWLAYGEGVLQFGIHGLVGALVFRVIWRRLMAEGKRT